MHLSLIISLFYVQPLLENNQNIPLPTYGPVMTNACRTPNSDNFRLVQGHDRFTTSHSVTYKNETLRQRNPLLCRSIVIDTVKGETTFGNKLKHGSRLDGNELNSSTVDDNGLNSSNGNGRSAFNETLDDEEDSSVFNVTFDEKARVDGYQVIKPEQSPYSLLLITKSSTGGGLCTGSLLTAEWVLTAGHCVTAEDGGVVYSIEIYAGGNSYLEVKSGAKLPASSQLTVASEFYAHPKYKPGTEMHDVAVVRARDKFKMTATVKTITLSTEPWTDVGYRTCTIVGFGVVNYKKPSVDDYKRKKHTLSVKNPCKCNFRLKEMFGMRYPTKSYICAKPVQDYGICSGDSGGGLICDGKIRAIAMMIVKMYDTSNCEEDIFSKVQCASDRALTVFLETCPYLRWINSHVKVLKEDLISPECVEYSGQPRVNRANLLCVTAAVAISLLLGVRG